MPIYQDCEFWDPVNRSNPARVLYLSQARNWMPVGIEVIVDFVDIGRFANTYYLNFQGDLLFLGDKKYNHPHV